MSPHLHIPLSRYQKTTRQPRWVVWLLVCLTLFCLVIIFWLSSIWFLRPVGLSAAPEGTQTAIQLFVNKKTWPVLEEVLLGVPLISNRNLTLRELSPFVLGELTWFFMEDGSRSVAIRSKESLLPTQLLDAHHVVIQKISSHLFLLSEKLQPISGMKTKRPLLSLLLSFLNRLGSYIEADSKKITPIFQKNRMISLDLPTNSQASDRFSANQIPESAYLVLSTPVYTKTNEWLAPQPLLSDASTSFFENLLTYPGLIILQNPTNPSFLLISDAAIDENERVRLIQTILALKYPQKQKKYLKDQTLFEEITSDPSLISVEQRILFGQEFHHATTGSGSLYVSKNGRFVLSDNEDLLKSWLNKEIHENVSELCNANVAYVSINKLLESNLYPTDIFTQDISRFLLGSFSSIALETKGKTTKLNMCY